MAVINPPESKLVKRSSVHCGTYKPLAAMRELKKKLFNGSGIDVGQEINIGPGKVGKNDKHRA